jgi:DNA-binding beta-propeller fold protein YncE
MLIIPAKALPFLVTLIVMSVLSCYSSYTDDDISTIAQEDNASILKNGYNRDNNNDYNSKTSSIENNGMDSAIANTSSLISSPPSFSNSGIDVNTFPVGIAVNPNTKKVYVANEYSNTVSVLDTETDKTS